MSPGCAGLSTACKGQEEALFFVKSSKTALDRSDFADSVRMSDTLSRPTSDGTVHPVLSYRPCQ